MIQPTQKVFESHELKELGIAYPRIDIEMPELPKEDRGDDPAEGYVDYSNGK